MQDFIDTLPLQQWEAPLATPNAGSPLTVHQDLVERVGRLELDMKENTEATKRIEANTAGLMAAFAALQGAFKVLHWIGKAAKPIGYIAAAVGAIVGAWAALRGGPGPR